MSISDEEIHRLRQGPYTVWNKRFLHESLMSALDELGRLRKENASLREDLKVTVQGYEKYEQQLEKAVEALRQMMDEYNGWHLGAPCACQSCKALELARAVLKELEK